MLKVHRKFTVASAGFLAAAAIGFTGIASAAPVTVNATLDNITGPVQSGNSAPAGARGNVVALLDFTVPTITGDANGVGASANPASFMTEISGNLSGLNLTLNANRDFNSGMDLAAFLTGSSGIVNFANATVTTALTGSQQIDNATAQILNPTFGGDGSMTVGNLTGGQLDLAGDNDQLAGLNLNGNLSDGSGTVTANGDVDMDGGDGDMMDGGDGMDGGDDGMGGDDMMDDDGDMMDGGDDGMDMDGGDDGMDMGDNGDGGVVTPPANGGGANDVPAPSGLGLMVLSLGLIGAGAAAKRRKGKSQNSLSMAA